MKKFYLIIASVCVIAFGLYVTNIYLADLNRSSFFSKNVFCPDRFNNFGPDPFSPGTEIITKIPARLGAKDVYLGGMGKTYSIWQKEFWESNPQIDITFCEQQYSKMLQHQRDVRLYTNIDYKNVVSWDEQKVLQAFGEPTKKEMNDNIEKWTYYPWEDKSNAVFINIVDKKLVSVVD